MESKCKAIKRALWDSRVYFLGENWVVSDSARSCSEQLATDTYIYKIIPSNPAAARNNCTVLPIKTNVINAMTLAPGSAPWKGVFLHTILLERCFLIGRKNAASVHLYRCKKLILHCMYHIVCNYAYALLNIRERCSRARRPRTSLFAPIWWQSIIRIN
jgi:hypothetical protein